MISDTLSDAIDEIRRYQREFPDIYNDLTLVIDEVVAKMTSLQQMLDVSSAGFSEE